MTLFIPTTFLLLFILIIIKTVNCKSVVSGQATTTSDPENDNVTLTTKIVLDEPTNFVLEWSSSPDDKYLILEMSASTEGYVAIGFSKDGSMRDSDLILGWFDLEGYAHVKDMHGTGNTRPFVDENQNYELISGEEEGGRTRIRFRRRWINCDAKNDRYFENEKLKIIWALGEHDPWRSDDGVFRPPYHFTMRGTWEGTEGKIKVPESLQTMGNEQC